MHRFNFSCQHSRCSLDGCVLIRTILSAVNEASVAQWLARSAVNRKVGGSTPPGGGIVFCRHPHVFASHTLRCVTRESHVSRGVILGAFRLIAVHLQRRETGIAHLQMCDTGVAHLQMCDTGEAQLQVCHSGVAQLQVCVSGFARLQLRDTGFAHLQMRDTGVTYLAACKRSRTSLSGVHDRMHDLRICDPSCMPLCRYRGLFRYLYSEMVYAMVGTRRRGDRCRSEFFIATLATASPPLSPP